MKLFYTTLVEMQVYRLHLQKLKTKQMKKTVRLTIKEYAKIKGCTPEAVRQLLHKGRLKFDRFGSSYVILETPKERAV